MQLTLTPAQALVLSFLLSAGAQAAAIPFSYRDATVVQTRDVRKHESRLLVEPVSHVAEVVPSLVGAVVGQTQHDPRGLLDPVVSALNPILGLLTGLLSPLTGIVSGLLGSLLLAGPSTDANSMHVYLVQANNASLAMVAATNVSDPAVLAAVNMSNTDAVLATLHVPVVNQTTMSIVDFCVTSTGPGPNALTAAPCREKSLSQLFVYNTNTNAVFAVPDLLTCAYAAANTTSDSATDAPTIAGTADVIMVERDMPGMSACNATSKAIMFTPVVSNQAVVTVTPNPSTASVAPGNTMNMDYAAGDHDEAALYDGTTGTA